MSALRYAGLIHGSHSNFGSGPPHCVSGTNGNANKDAFLVPYLHSGRLQSISPRAKQTLFCLHLSSSICDHQADRGVCCYCSRPIVLCLESHSYLHNVFKQTNKWSHISREKEVGVFYLYSHIQSERIKSHTPLFL